MTDDLKTLFPGVEISVGGEALMVKPFPFEMLPKVVAFVRKFAGGLEGDPETKKVDVMRLLEEASGDLLPLVAQAVGKPLAFVAALPFDEGVRLTEAVLTVNQDVFTKAVLPKLLRLLGGVGLSTGETSSAPSSPLDTAGLTSSSTP
ncbi:MAG TPA: hypothetical protein VMZ31_20100 [Phycisphaerae bacterium]|nr:hypothetical protein [Phycisphaerae bacterium]